MSRGLVFALMAAMFFIGIYFGLVMADDNMKYFCDKNGRYIINDTLMLYPEEYTCHKSGMVR